MKITKKVKVVNLTLTVYNLKEKKLEEVNCSVVPVRGKIITPLNDWAESNGYKVCAVESSEEVEKVYSMTLDKFIENAEQE